MPTLDQHSFERLIVDSMLELYTPAANDRDWRVNLGRILRFAGRNQMVLQIAGRLVARGSEPLPEDARAWLDEIVGVGLANLAKQRATARVLKGFLMGLGIQFLVAKTWRPQPYFTRDIDVLVHPENWNQVIEELNTRGLAAGHHRGRSDDAQRNVKSQELLTIDLHSAFTWMGFEHCSSEALWQNPVERDYQGVGVNSPTPAVEFLLLCAHIVHERRFMTLLDVQFYLWLLAEVDESEPEELAAEAGWIQEYQWFRSWAEAQIKELLEVEVGVGLRSMGFSDRSVAPSVLERFPVNTPYFAAVRGYVRSVRRGYWPGWFDPTYFVYSRIRQFATGGKYLPYFTPWTPCPGP